MFKTILVPIDVNDIETAEPALAQAVAIAHGSDAALRLIHVRSDMPRSVMEFVPPNFDAKQFQECEDKLSDVAAGLGLPEDRVSTVVTVGSVRHQVLKEAERIGADLIVVGAHQPSNLMYLLGSNAAAIVRHATCSVLVVRR
jgi:nucleotide-binding universal stress UspA family protein